MRAHSGMQQDSATP